MKCNNCHTPFIISGYVYNVGQGLFCSGACNYSYKKGKPRKDKVTWGDKISKSRIGKFCGSNHPNWKGGKRYERKSGYVIVYSPDHPFPTHTSNYGKTKYVYEHRLVMERKLGRYLSSKEEVHHINGIKDDNRIENLMLFESKGLHSSLERTKQPRYQNGRFRSR
jgi:hypothetical protein